LNNGNQCRNKEDKNSLCNVNKLILVSCSEKQREKELCMTDICKRNRDCFSNNCVDGVCMVNDDNPAYICRTVVRKTLPEINCLLAYEEKCTKDSECGDNTHCGKENICINTSSKITGYKKYIINGIITVLIILFGVGIYLVIKYHNKIEEAEEQ